MYKEVDVSNKKHARIRIWAFACEWHQPPDPHLISESYFSLFFCGTTPSGQFVVGLVPTLLSLYSPTRAATAMRSNSRVAPAHFS